jgi:hypothetical protein
MKALAVLLLPMLLASCGGAEEPAPVAADPDEAEGRKRGWFYNGLSEHPKQAVPFVESLAWRLPDEAGQPLFYVWLSSAKLDADERERMRPATPGAPENPETVPAAFGHAGVLLRFDEQGRNDGQMTDFCPRRNEQVQCVGMSGVGALVITGISAQRVDGAFYTTDTDTKQTYVAQFQATLRADEVEQAAPAGLRWLAAGGGEPGAAYLKRNKAALDTDVETLKSYSLPETAEFVDKPGNAALLARMAATAPIVLGGSQLDESATLFVRDSDNHILRVDLRFLDDRWRVASTRQ